MKKSFKTAISLICAVALIMSVSAVTVSAESLSENLSAVVSEIISGIKSCKNSIDISKYNVSADDFGDLYFDILYDNPELFNVKSSYSYSMTGNGKIISIAPKYIMTSGEYQTKRVEFDSVVNDYMSYISDDMTEFTKALILHDLIARRCVYSPDYYLGNTVPDNCYTAYGALVEKEAVCQGYSTAYHYLLSLCGVESGYAQSDAMNHVWNMVKIGGNYYHVDVTWDDPTYLYGHDFVDLAGNVQHAYFLRTDSEFQTDCGASQIHHDWVSDYTATSTAYSNSFVRSIAKTGVSYYGGYYYYVDGNGVLVKQKQGTTAKQTVYEIEREKWNTDGSKYLIWNTIRSRVFTVGNLIYFTECKRVLMLDLANDTAAPVVVGTPTLKNDECLYGLEIVNNQGYCDIYNDTGKTVLSRQPFELDAPNYDFTVTVTDSNSNALGSSISGYIGDEFDLSINSESGISDTYTVEVTDPKIALYNASAKKITFIGVGSTTITVTSNTDKSCVQKLSLTVRQKQANKPSAPTLESKTESSVTLKAVAGCEYSMDKVNWQSSNVFSNLESDKDYTFYMRVAATKDVLASDISNGLKVHLSSSNETLYGDCNYDGKINLLDLLTVRKYLAKWNVTIDLTAADCNGDGKVNLLDLLAIRKYLAKWDIVLGPQNK